MNTKNPQTLASCIASRARKLFRKSCLATLASVSALGFLSAFGQGQTNILRCASFNIHQMLLATDPSYVTNRANLESFTTTFVNDVRSRGAEGMRDGIVTIPVVVHVIYHTPTEDISDAQIQSQIDVLNADYRALNTDIGGVPAPFAPLVGDQRVRFVLAARDPDCNPTTGITRTATTRTGFVSNDAMKSASSGGHDAWPRDKYLNLWICNLTDYLGYAQFPGGPAATDGVVIRYTCFGTSGTATAPFNLGRTATHEIGHWLNLNHIWGDDGCGLNGDVVCGDGSSCLGTDNVDDTPNQTIMHFSCPSFPQISCGNAPNGDMFMNYMDYTDDSCMFMFTQGQVDRMNACLYAPSPTGRAEILGSDGAIPPTGVPGADLWAQDTPEDTGAEPNTASTWMCISDDIWVRVNNDGVAHQDHENPVYNAGASPNYIYVRVRNRGCGASGSATLKLYWAKASSALGWPAPWDGSVTAPALMGSLIGSQSTGSVPPGGYVILQFPWNPPNPADYASFGGDKSHFCLLARIETSPTFPFGMTISELAGGVDQLVANVRNNNNIVWKNLTVVSGTGRSASTTMANAQNQANQNRLVFDVPPHEHSVFNWGTVNVDLGPTLFQKWQQAGSVGFGISVNGNLIQLLNPGAVIAGLQLSPGELDTISVKFDRFSWFQPVNGVFPLILTQEQLRNGQYVNIGGNIFRVKDRFTPLSGCIDIQCPTNIVRYVCGTNGTPVTFSVSATNYCNPTNLIVNTSRASGSWFSLGTTTVDSWAYGSGQSNHCSFTVTVLQNPNCGSQTNCIDIHCPTNVNAYAPCGSNCVSVPFTVSATDRCSSNQVSVVTDYPSGYCFPIGTTWVNSTAYGSGQTNHCSFAVTVLPNPNCGSQTNCIDIHCSTNVTAYTCGSNCVPVYYGAWAQNLCNPNDISVFVNPPSGTCFGLGNHTVDVWAIGSGQTNHCSFTVTVLQNPNCGGGNGCSTNLLVNGSFEIPGVPDGYVALPGGNTVITGWTTLLNGLEYFNPVVAPLSVNSGFAADGVYLLDLTPMNGAGGGIQQTFATMVGQSYRITFAMGTSKERGRNGTASLTATVAGAAHSFNLTTASPTIVWERKEFSFVATTTTATLVFSTMDDPASSFVNLDDVRVSDCCQDSGLNILPTVTVEWKCGVLQSAPEVTGPYTDVPGATSPYTVPASDPRRFFRTRN